MAFFTVDVEDWFHILDSPNVPPFECWTQQEQRLERGLTVLLELLAEHGIKATLFWLGWAAERYPQLVERCHGAGHEIASHGYAHVLAYQVGWNAFRNDVRRAKTTIEDLLGRPVQGYRAPGFGITAQTPWAFEILAEEGHTYDSSVFPAKRGHGGICDAPVGSYIISTPSGPLHEVTMSVVKLAGFRLMLFGGGYLRIAPTPVIRWGCRQLARRGLPIVIYVHPRELDPRHPRLPLPPVRRFKCYVNLESTYRKLKLLCSLPGVRFRTLRDWLDEQKFRDVTPSRGLVNP